MSSTMYLLSSMLTWVLTMYSMSLVGNLGSTTKEHWFFFGTIEVSVYGCYFTFICAIRLHNSIQRWSLITFFCVLMLHCQHFCLCHHSMSQVRCLPSSRNNSNSHLKYTFHHLHSKLAEALSYYPTSVACHHILFPWILFFAALLLLSPFQNHQECQKFH